MRRPSLIGFTGLMLTFVLCLVGFGCGDDSDSDATANPEELLEQGPFPVGYRDITITYGDAGTLEPRELVLRVWYPASSETDAGPAEYAVAGVVNLPALNALDAPAVTEESDLPFAIYSHGSGGEGLLGYPYGELMASHGWVVAAPNHTGNTALDEFLGSRDSAARTALDRPNDITAIIDEFESGLSGDDLEGKADTSRVYVVGHSVGGYTAFAAAGADVDFDEFIAGCEGTTSEACDLLADPNIEAAYRAGFGDPRVVAIAPQAPALGRLPQSELAALEVPALVMSGRLDQTTTQEESAEPAWAGVDYPGDLWVEMPTGGHLTFITVCHDLEEAVLNALWRDASGDGCGDAFIPTTEAVPVLAAYVLAFGRLHVLGETEWESVLTGPALGDGFVITTR